MEKVDFPQEIWDHEFASRPQAALEWLWHGFVAPGNLTLLTSLWKSGKTTLLALLLSRRKYGGCVLRTQGRRRCRKQSRLRRDKRVRCASPTRRPKPRKTVHQQGSDLLRSRAVRHRLCLPDTSFIGMAESWRR